MKNTKVMFFCGVDSDKYYYRIDKTLKDEIYIYSIYCSDVEYYGFKNINSAYNIMFKRLYYLVESYFNKWDEEITKYNFYYKTYITKEKCINKDIIELFEDNELILVQFNKKTLHIITNTTYREYKNKLNLEKYVIE